MNLSSFFYAFRMLFVPLGGRRDNGKVKGALLGIIFSLIPVTVAIQVASGMIAGIIERYQEVGSFHIVGQSYSPQFNQEAAQWADKIKTQEGVKTAVAILEGSGLLSSSTGRSALAIKGVPSSLYQEDEGFRRYFQMLEGEFDLGANDSLLVSEGIAKTLSIKVGDTVRLLINREAAGRCFLQSVPFRVTGVFTTGYYELDQMSGYINYNRSMGLFGRQGTAAIAIKVINPEDHFLALTTGELSAHFNQEGIFFRTWKEKNLSLVENLQSTFSLIAAIACVIILLAAVNILSIMVALELEKRQSVALLRSLGVSAQRIFISFLSVGLLIGIWGTLIGIGLGLWISVNFNTFMEILDSVATYLYGFLSGLNGEGFFQNTIEILNKDYYLDDIPLVIQWNHICLISILTILSSGLAALIPAVAAMLRKPVDVMKDF